DHAWCTRFPGNTPYSDSSGAAAFRRSQWAKFQRALRPILFLYPVLPITHGSHVRVLRARWSSSVRCFCCFPRAAWLCACVPSPLPAFGAGRMAASFFSFVSIFSRLGGSLALFRFSTLDRQQRRGF